MENRPAVDEAAILENGKGELGNTPNPHHGPSNLWILFLLVAIALGCTNHATSPKAESEKTEAGVIASAGKESIEVPPPEEKTVFEFTFESVPEGAFILRNGKHVLCGPTPCRYRFRSSELADSPIIVFKKSGYENYDVLLCEGDYEKTGGKIRVNLMMDKDAEILVFTLNYTPKDAQVIDDDMKAVLCYNSPCEVRFNIFDKLRALIIKLEGYESQYITLTTKAYLKTDGNIDITLHKKPDKDPRKSENCEGITCVFENGTIIR